MKTIKDAMRSRRSVRSFEDRALSEEDLKKIEKILEEVENPFGVPISFKILDKDKYGLMSPVITGDRTYIAAKLTPGEPLWELAYGYSFEKLCLLLEALGIGTTIIGGTFKRKAFEDAMKLEDREIMPLATPVGYPAKKKSVRERMMRKAVKADERLPFEDLFFNKTFDRPLQIQEAGAFKEPLELLRLAPSAVNKQPWRALVDGNTVHFYKDSSRPIGESPYGDVQRLDVGIGIANFDLALKEDGYEGEFFIAEPEIESPETMEYLVSYRLTEK